MGVVGLVGAGRKPKENLRKTYGFGAAGGPGRGELTRGRPKGNPRPQPPPPSAMAHGPNAGSETDEKETKHDGAKEPVSRRRHHQAGKPKETLRNSGKPKENIRKTY